jgi:hypothetical protein
MLNLTECGFTIETRTTSIWLIAERFPNSNDRNCHFETKSVPKKKSLILLFGKINALNRPLKPKKAESSNKITAESLLSLKLIYPLVVQNMKVRITYDFF